MKISQFRTNEQKEKEGVWVKIGEDARIKVARLGNARYKELFQKLTNFLCIVFLYNNVL